MLESITICRARFHTCRRPAFTHAEPAPQPSGGGRDCATCLFQGRSVGLGGMLLTPSNARSLIVRAIPLVIFAATLSGCTDLQVLVRVTLNATAKVTVVGEVSNSARVPLTARGERLLDAWPRPAA